MKKIVRLTENDLIKLVKRVVKESENNKFKPKEVLGSTKLKYIESSTFHPNHKDERHHLSGFIKNLENENWNSNNGIIIFKYEDEIYVAPDCDNDMGRDYLKEYFGRRNENIGVPSYLAQSDSWYSKSAFREFTQPCR
jgi:hypothetical protein